MRWRFHSRWIRVKMTVRSRIASKVLTRLSWCLSSTLNTEHKVTEKFDRHDKGAEAEIGVKWGEEDVWWSVGKCCRPWKDDGDSCARQCTGNVCGGCTCHDKKTGCCHPCSAASMKRAGSEARRIHKPEGRNPGGKIRVAKSGQLILDSEKHSPTGSTIRVAKSGQGILDSENHSPTGGKTQGTKSGVQNPGNGFWTRKTTHPRGGAKSRGQNPGNGFRTRKITYPLEAKSFGFGKPLPHRGQNQWKTGQRFRGFSTIQQVRIGETCMWTACVMTFWAIYGLRWADIHECTYINYEMTRKTAGRATERTHWKTQKIVIQSRVNT